MSWRQNRQPTRLSWLEEYVFGKCVRVRLSSPMYTMLFVASSTSESLSDDVDTLAWLSGVGGAGAGSTEVGIS